MAGIRDRFFLRNDEVIERFKEFCFLFLKCELYLLIITKLELRIHGWRDGSTGGVLTVTKVEEEENWFLYVVL